MRLVSGVAIGSLLLFSLSGPAEATIISLDPSRTYFHTDSTDTGGDAIPIELISLGLVSGDLIRLRVVGDFSYCFPGSFCDSDTGFGTTAVFASSPVLLGRNESHRVPGAIERGFRPRHRPDSVRAGADGHPAGFLHQLLLRRFRGDSSRRHPLVLCASRFLLAGQPRPRWRLRRQHQRGPGAVLARAPRSGLGVARVETSSRALLTPGSPAARLFTPAEESVRLRRFRSLSRKE